MAEVKRNYEGISKYSATLVFTALASSPSTAFLTTGFLGKLVFFFLKRWSNWLANQGIALANLGADKVIILQEKGAYNKAFDEAFNKILSTKRPLTEKEKHDIDEQVKKAFRRFGTFV